MQTKARGQAREEARRRDCLLEDLRRRQAAEQEEKKEATTEEEENKPTLAVELLLKVAVQVQKEEELKLRMEEVQLLQEVVQRHMENRIVEGRCKAGRAHTWGRLAEERPRDEEGWERSTHAHLAVLHNTFQVVLLLLLRDQEQQERQRQMEEGRLQSVEVVSY